MNDLWGNKPEMEEYSDSLQHDHIVVVLDRNMLAQHCTYIQH